MRLYRWSFCHYYKVQSPSKLSVSLITAHWLLLFYKFQLSDLMKGRDDLRVLTGISFGSVTSSGYVTDVGKISEGNKLGDVYSV